MRHLHWPGRSPAMATKAMAATSHPLATEAALAALRAGGNAMDAALTANAVQAVVEPSSTAIGGDCFALYTPKGAKKPIAMNGSGYAPKAISSQALRDQGLSEVPRQSPHSVTIPGAIDAWFRSNADFGRMGMDDILAPAIAFARDGYPILPRVSFDFVSQIDIVQNNPETARIFMPHGAFPQVGDMHYQPDLAKSLEKIAKEGRNAFYQGELAEKMVNHLKSLGGYHDMDDFAEYRADYVEPISTRWNGMDMYQCPPNGQGIIALQLLKIMEKLHDPAMGLLDAERIHLEIEAGRLAYGDRDRYVADPSFETIPVEAMLSDGYIEKLIAQIDREQAMQSVPEVGLPKHQSTVYITVVDQDGNACSLINTIFDTFGAALTVPETGILLQNRGQGFTLEAGHPNELAGRKRPLHTIIPGMAFQDGKVRMPYGVMGGQYQAFGHMQFLTAFMDYDLDIQQALDRPRFFPKPGMGQVDVEATHDVKTIETLKAMGHTISVPRAPIGGGQAIWIGDNGVLTAGSDPRKDGLALGF